MTRNTTQEHHQEHGDEHHQEHQEEHRTEQLQFKKTNTMELFHD